MSTNAAALRPLLLPPPFHAVAAPGGRDAFGRAVGIAGSAGAGTLVHGLSAGVLDMAVVVEPEEPLSAARRVVYLGLSALADALAPAAPAEKAVTFAWPDTLLMDCAVVGGVRLAWPAETAEDAVPAFLVLGAMLRLEGPPGEEPGRWRRGTALAEEGADVEDPSALVEGFSRHLLLQVDRWQADGFIPLAERWLARLPREGDARRGIDGNGDLLIDPGDGRPVERRALGPALAGPGWLDPATGAPWL